MANRFKAYCSDADKYYGKATNNHEYKFMSFLERCDQGDIPDYDRERAFLIMFVGHARQVHFYDLKQKSLGLSELEFAVKLRFSTSERTRALLQAWEATTLT